MAAEPTQLDLADQLDVLRKDTDEASQWVDWLQKELRGLKESTDRLDDLVISMDTRIDTVQNLEQELRQLTDEAVEAIESFDRFKLELSDVHDRIKEKARAVQKIRDRIDDISNELVDLRHK